MRRKAFLAESQSLWQQRKGHQAEVRQRRLQIQKEKYQHQLQAAGRHSHPASTFPTLLHPNPLIPTPVDAHAMKHTYHLCPEHLYFSILAIAP